MLFEVYFGTINAGLTFSPCYLATLLPCYLIILLPSYHVTCLSRGYRKTGGTSDSLEVYKFSNIPTSYLILQKLGDVSAQRHFLLQFLEEMKEIQKLEIR